MPCLKMPPPQTRHSGNDQNMMRGVWLFFLGFAGMMVMGAPMAGAQVSSLPRLQVSGNLLVTSDQTPITLRGVSLCSLEWHKPLILIDSVTNPVTGWGGNVLRLPIQPREWRRIGGEAYLKNYLDPAVRKCRTKGIYCILDWHQIAPWQDEKTQKDLENFWAVVAPRYAHDPNILYEVFNEPTKPGHKTTENWLIWRDTVQKWVDQIQKVAPQTPLLIGSPHWSQMTKFSAQYPLRGDNLLYVMHLYPNLGDKDWDVLFGNAAKSVPVFISEWGWSSDPQTKGNVIHGTKAGFGEKLKSYLADKPYIHWTAWSYDPKCAPAMTGRDQDMAAFVRAWLADYK